MTYTGVVRGRTIEIAEPLPFPEGQTVRLEVEPAEAPRAGDPQAILEALRSMPPLPDETVAALERSIEEGRLPVRYEGVFDEETS